MQESVDPPLAAGSRMLLAGHRAEHFDWHVAGGVGVLTLSPQPIIAAVDGVCAGAGDEPQAQALCLLTEDFGRACRAVVAEREPVFEGN